MLHGSAIASSLPLFRPAWVAALPVQVRVCLPSPVEEGPPVEVAVAGAPLAAEVVAVQPVAVGAEVAEPRAAEEVAVLPVAVAAVAAEPLGEAAVEEAEAPRAVEAAELRLMLAVVEIAWVQSAEPAAPASLQPAARQDARRAVRHWAQDRVDHLKLAVPHSDLAVWTPSLAQRKAAAKAKEAQPGVRHRARARIRRDREPVDQAWQDDDLQAPHPAGWRAAAMLAAWSIAALHPAKSFVRVAVPALRSADWFVRLRAAAVGLPARASHSARRGADDLPAGRFLRPRGAAAAALAPPA
jgi:hypothetical protein